MQKHQQPDTVLDMTRSDLQWKKQDDCKIVYESNQTLSWLALRSTPQEEIYTLYYGYYKKPWEVICLSGEFIDTVLLNDNTAKLF